MLRCAVFALAVCATLPDSRAAGPDLNGHWIFSNVLPTGESAVCILKVADEGGKPAASVAFAPKGTEIVVSAFTAADKQVSFVLKQTSNLQGREIVSEMKFVGTPGKDGKVVLGNVGSTAATAAAVLPRRASLRATDKTEIAAAQRLIRSPAADDYAAAQTVSLKPLQLQAKMQAKDTTAEARTTLQKELTAARDDVAEKLPGMYRGLVAKYPDAVAAGEAAMALLRNPQVKLTPDEAAKLADAVKAHSEPYGPRFATSMAATLAEAVAPRKDVGTLGLSLAEPLAKALTDATKAVEQVKVLAMYKTALEVNGKGDEAKAVDSRIAKLEAKLDEEYLATPPPFQPKAYAGRKADGANRVAVMELFTGAQCAPCIAADVAFDALAKSYKPADLVLIQYHLHIPGPDPLTNSDSQARARYYAASSTPSTFFNGKADARGGGGMTLAEKKYAQYAAVIDPLLEQKTAVTVGGKATRTRDTVNISVTVEGADGEDLRLRLLMVEETVRYTGSNQLRFHHHVVRSMPGGANGVAVTDKAFRHTANVFVSGVRLSLTKYLDDYGANTRPFPNPARPLDMKHLKVIAVVQNDKTKEIVQAAQFDLGEKAAGGE